MGLKETDKVRMLGIVPSQGADPIPVGKIPDDATQVATSGRIENTTSERYVVPAATTFYLLLMTAHSFNDSGADCETRVEITTAADAVKYRIVYHTLPDQAHEVQVTPFPTPLEIPTGYKIKAYSGATGGYIHLFIFGYTL